MLGIKFCMPFVVCWFVFETRTLSEKFFQEYHQSANKFRILIRPDGFVGPDQVPNCFQKLSADDTIVQAEAAMV